MNILLTSDSTPARDLVHSILIDRGNVIREPDELGAGALATRSDWVPDAVIAAMFGDQSTPARREAILVEIGIAIGRGLPVLLLAAPGQVLPSLAGVPRVSVDIDDRNTLALKIDLFLQAILQNSPSEPTLQSATVGAPISAPVQPFKQGLILEESVGHLLKLAGAQLILSDKPNSKDHAGFAFYIPGHEIDIGVVLVEVKSIVNSKDAQNLLRHAANHLSSQVLRNGAALGMIVHDGKPIKVHSTPMTVSISMSELAAELENADLLQVIKLSRNRAVHGM
ncbi:hypothetical protein NXT08_22670 [Rhodococcus pyridinivorans]|uniref:hypothetical protein n=1 Tax=Rhodococcus pyridinivorans TaxID=103816 RepID=UPI00216490DA|nr:hypothetical protein [Rhodococcus pyridinivorans]UVT25007.1 hypothetical protein NXT08_22670 [Rhodococcus pyridinivorans]